MSRNLSPSAASLQARAIDASSSHQALSSIGELRQASSPFDLLQGMRRSCAEFGVRSALFVHVNPDSAELASHYLMLACNARLAASIRNCRSLARHPWTRYAARNVEPIRASDLRLPARMTASPTVDLEGNGFRSALLIPVHCAGGTGRFSLLCLGAEETNHFGQTPSPMARLLGKTLATELHVWWMAETRRHLLLTAGLRESDLELLGMELEGLSTKQISRALDMSCASVDSRFQRINVRMGCANRRASAHKAACHGLI